LAGDSSLYAVLPTNTVTAGVAVTSVGVLLSANRFIRLVLNGPAGIAYDRWRRRPLFVSALFIGAISTALYGLTQGFWPLFVGRLLWGLAWSGIWVGGNTIVLDITREDTRGRWVGLYQLAFFLGTSGGAMLGGILTDWLGYHNAMIINASLTLAGAIVALILLPETRGLREQGDTLGQNAAQGLQVPDQARTAEFASATALYAANRIALAGILSSTFGLFLLELLGEQTRIAGYTLGIATLTGLGLGLSRLISMAAAPYLGGLSDRASSRWRVAAGGLVPGVAGFGLLSLGLPLATAFSVPLTAITAGSNQSLATAVIGDLGNSDWQSRRLGLLYTVGDLASAVGPPLAYGLIPWIGLRAVYLMVAVLLGLVLLVTLWRAAEARRRLVQAEVRD
jgi:MFS family permease